MWDSHLLSVHHLRHLLTEQLPQLGLPEWPDGPEVLLPLDHEPLPELRALGPRAFHELLRLQRGHGACLLSVSRFNWWMTRLTLNSSTTTLSNLYLVFGINLVADRIIQSGGSHYVLRSRSLTKTSRKLWIYTVNNVNLIGHHKSLSRPRQRFQGFEAHRLNVLGQVDEIF